MKLVDCGDHVWLGDLYSCDEKRQEFENVIHIWREAHFDEHTCRLVRHGEARGAGDFVLKYYEHASLLKADRTIDEIVDFARRPGKLLVHCAGGAVRSATVAVLAKSARGCDPYTALADICRQMRTPDYNKCPFNNEGLAEILSFKCEPAASR